jgi:hypothetical protein
MVVTRVREGFVATPSHEAVERDVSTKVIVVVATGTDVAAETVDGFPTVADHVMERRERRRPTTTTLSRMRWCRAPIVRREPRNPETQEENADDGGICTEQGCWTEPAGRAACMTLFTIGPAIEAPSDPMFWNGTTTATAIWGLFAGANPIIQSWLTDSPVWAVPVLTAAHR